METPLRMRVYVETMLTEPDRRHWDCRGGSGEGLGYTTQAALVIGHVVILGQMSIEEVASCGGKSFGN